MRDDVRPDPDGTEHECLMCNLTWPRGELPEGANQSSPSASSGRDTGEQPHTVTKSGIPTASGEIENPPPDMRATSALAARLEPPGEPLDERELRIMRLLYGEDICPYCTRLSCRRAP
jgi:hypothetical protein